MPTQPKTLAGLAVLVMVIVLTAMADSTMQPLPASAPIGEFSAERALGHLREFATEPRPVGSPAGDRARDFLAGRLRAEGLQVEVQRAVGARPASGLATFGQVDNVVAKLPGTDPTGTVLVAAHYDSAAMGPGASDDGTAVAAMIETVRALRVGTGPRNDVVLLMSDGEEDGVLGAEAFVRRHPLGRGGGVLLNWEARGVRGPSLMFETSRNNARLVETFAGAVPAPRGDSSMVELYRLLPNNTDFTPLTKAGFTGMNFAYIRGSSLYHTAGDSIANLDPGSLQHHGSTMLAMTRVLGGTDLRTLTSDHDVTYFRAFGVMITYPGTAVRPLAVLALSAVAALVVYGRARRLLTLPRLAVATVSAVLPLVVSVVLAQGLWELLVGLRPAYDTMGGLLHRPLAFEASIAALSGFAVLCWYLPLRRRLGPVAMTAGALFWPAGLGALCAWFAPGAAFLFTLPALTGALGALAALMTGPAWVRVAATTLGPVTAGALLPSLAWNVFDGMGLALGGVGALVLALFWLGVSPLAEPFRPGRAVPLTAAVLALALVGVGLVTDGFDAGRPGRTHLAYVMDADTRAARWVSADPEPAEWTRRYVTGRDVTALPPGYARGSLWTGPAPAITADGPRVAVSAYDGTTLTMRVTADRGARSVTLRLDRPIAWAGVSAGRFGQADVPVTGERAGTWPGEIRFRGIPAQGVQVTVRLAPADQVRVIAISETDGLSRVPGFVPRPVELVAATREDGDLVAVTRGYTLRRDSRGEGEAEGAQ
ncbi:M28 family peptidase [Streptosporangium saharense]|uniref:M28 family peptidase n=1 Tax=Streptosporangium saharense TaxID=1706840 RepID=UPI00331C6C94